MKDRFIRIVAIVCTVTFSHGLGTVVTAAESESNVLRPANDKNWSTSLGDLPRIRSGKTGRASSWQTNGKNNDGLYIPAGESRVLADLKGPGVITHIWMSNGNKYRTLLLKFTWDDADHASILVPLGDFFCLGNNMVNSFQSHLFSATTPDNHQMSKGCHFNSYAPMPYAKRAKVEMINESTERIRLHYYIDYETVDHLPEDMGYFHAEFRRANPFGGWGQEMSVGSDEPEIVHRQRLPWDNNYVILETKGRGHYVGCNLSLTNFHGEWWGEGDDMIWVDGYKWPPDLHGTGSEDYLGQGGGMQDNAFLRCGSSIFEGNTLPPGSPPYPRFDLRMGQGGYQTSYVFHIENPVRFQREIKVTIEVGHGNHLRNEYSSVAYWYAEKPTRVLDPPPVEKRMPVLRDENGKWIFDEKNQVPSPDIQLTKEMKERKEMVRTKRGG